MTRSLRAVDVDVTGAMRIPLRDAGLREQIPPRADVVDHGHHEDRPRGTPKARARDGAQRVRRLLRRRRGRARHRPDRCALRSSSAALLPRRRVRRVRAPALGLVVRETQHHVEAESKLQGELPAEGAPTQREVFWRTTLLDKNLSSVSQAGLVNNLNDGMAWGLFPLFFTAARMDLGQIGTLAAIYPATWGIAQLFTGAWSDRVGRKWLIASGMWVQAVGIALVVLAGGFAGFAAGAALLGVGTAMVYPTLLAAIGDVAHPSWRASSVGVYRLWRDLGYAIGALLAGLTADALDLPSAMWLVAALTFVSGLVVAGRMRETLRPPGPRKADPAQMGAAVLRPS